MSYKIEKNENKIILEDDWNPKVIKIIQDSSINRLNLERINWSDYTVLAPIAHKITTLFFLYPLTASSKGLEKFINVKYLHLDDEITPDFDVSCFQSLEKAELCWNNKFTPDFFRLPKLKKLQLRYFDEIDCEKIGVSSSIKELAIYESKLRNLDGLEKIKSLRELDLAYIRVLEDISKLSHLPLKKLDISNCFNVKDLSSITTLSQLESLKIGKFKVGFDDLDWVANLKNIQTVYNETEVKSLNWGVILGNRSLLDFTTKTHEGYSISDDELHAIASEFGRVITSIERFPTKKNPTISIMLDVKEEEWMYSVMYEEGNISFDQLSEKLGKSRSEVVALLKMLNISK